jgi:hypothetical protein
LAINFPSSPTNGQIFSSNSRTWIFNSSANVWLASTSTGAGGYYVGNNGEVGASQGLGDIFRLHSNTLSFNVSVSAGNNAIAAGPIIVTPGYTLTINTGARVAIV